MLSEPELLQKMTEVGTELQRDPLSELSRTRQKWLLIASFVTILLAVEVASPEKGMFPGVRFDIQKPELTLLIAGIVTIYLIILYSLTVWQDRRTWKYELSATMLKFHECKEQIADMVYDQIGEVEKLRKKVHEITQGRLGLMDERDEIAKKYSAQLEMLWKELSQTTEQVQAVLKKDKTTPEQAFAQQHALRALVSKRSAILQRIDSLKSMEEKEIKPYDELLDEPESGRTTKKLLDKMIELGKDETHQKRLDYLINAYKTHRSSKRFRTMLEIFFPIVLGLCAIWTAFETQIMKLFF